MSIKVRLLIGVGLILVLILIVNMVRRRKLELKYVLGWLLCDLALLILTVFPGFMVKASKILGIYSPVNMIFFLGFLFSLMIIFTLTVALSRVTERVRRLSQMLALESWERDQKESEFPEESHES